MRECNDFFSSNPKRCRNFQPYHKAVSSIPDYRTQSLVFSGFWPIAIAKKTSVLNDFNDTYKWISLLSWERQSGNVESLKAFLVRCFHVIVNHTTDTARPLPLWGHKKIVCQPSFPPLINSHLRLHATLGWEKFAGMFDSLTPAFLSRKTLPK